MVFRGQPDDGHRLFANPPSLPTMRVVGRYEDYSVVPNCKAKTRRAHL
ncbi:hypothetical protein LCGC14_1086280 [marine sediment metagenome]|uniref:Uncharacterized protein n=1 Tax=marine sediment metagenome TaxID=412755 RepID=A0A0F9N1B1_9ZZZZ